MAIFEDEKLSNHVINNGMTSDDVVAFDVPPRYLLVNDQKSHLDYLYCDDSPPQGFHLTMTKGESTKDDEGWVNSS